MSKQWGMKMRQHPLLSLLAGVLLSSSALADTAANAAEADISAADLGISDYRYFIIYPHLEKAFLAQRHHDEKTALQEFQHVHQQAPDSTPLTLYLSEAYRYFGHDDRAQELLNEQRNRHPEDARLQQAFNAIPVREPPIDTIAALVAQQQRCAAHPSTRCRSDVGHNALRLGDVTIALQQLHAADFATTPPGQALLENALQRAIYLQQWQAADEVWALRQQQRALSPAEQQAWFHVLMAGNLDDRIETLQQQGLWTSAADQLTYASSLTQHHEIPRLQRYLERHSPVFQTANEEKGWLYLLSRYSAHPQQALAQYPTRFLENRRYVVGATLPDVLKDKHYAEAQALLSTVPASDMLEERYSISQATHNAPETLHLARQLYAQRPSLPRLDSLVWQLTKAGHTQEAAALLLKHYPFKSDNASRSLTLLARLVGLLSVHPEWASSAQRAGMSAPLPTAQQRDLQRQLPGFIDDCRATRHLLGDMSARYSAEAWGQLANCYRSDRPDMALYAFQQAEQRRPSGYYQRAIAYQAYAVHDYSLAVRAWQMIPLAMLADHDLIAAANTAQTAGDVSARDHWLAEAQKRGLANSEQYWWLHAQRYVPDQPRQALQDLNHAIHSTPRPSAQTYVSRAGVYQQLGSTRQALADLQRAQAIEPDNDAILVALGYAYANNGELASSRDTLEKAQQRSPGAIEVDKQLAYANQRLGDAARAQRHARLVVDDLDRAAQLKPLTPEQRQQRFDFRRLHEDAARRWSFNLDATMGLSSGAISHSASGNDSASQRHRSFSQLEAEYRLGRNRLIAGDQLSVYGRLLLDTSNSGAVVPHKQPILGTGLRWKPLQDHIVLLAIEQQTPLDHRHGENNLLARASASFLNNGRFSDEWHPNGNGWAAQNLYVDAGQYQRHNMRTWTADYRFGYHHKVAVNQTIEPYAHIQANRFRGQDTISRGGQWMGIGVRWNLWSGETHYDAAPHNVNIGAEYQRILNDVNQRTDKRNGAFITIGAHW